MTFHLIEVENLAFECSTNVYQKVTFFEQFELEFFFFFGKTLRIIMREEEKKKREQDYKGTY